jgi:hypothetical protein
MWVLVKIDFVVELVLIQNSIADLVGFHYRGRMMEWAWAWAWV